MSKKGRENLTLAGHMEDKGGRKKRRVNCLRLVKNRVLLRVKKTEFLKRHDI